MSERFPITSVQDDFTVSAIQDINPELGVGGPTNLELALYAMLNEEDVDFVPEWPVPGTSFRLDAYDPVNKIGYEADGPWHDPKRDKNRDKIICRTPHVREVRRYDQKALRSWL